MSTRKTTLFYAVLVAVASAAVGMVIASQWGLPSPSSAQSLNVPAANSAALSGPIDAQTFRTIAKSESPTVVSIRTTSRVRGRELTEFFGGNEDFFQRFFGGQPQGPQSPRRQQQRDLPQREGMGTGFIIDKSGFILTNNHVVEEAEDIRVNLFGAPRTRTYTAKVVGRDELTDTALIQLTEMPSTALQEAKFGDSSVMEPGDWVVAIGNPFELSHSVTVGVISALGRPVGGVSGRPQPMLQTDAAINPGNSGGPLLNIRGEVVGINTAIYSAAQSPTNMGIGFAMPINAVRDLLPQLREGKVTRGVISVQVYPEPMTDEMARAFGLPSPGGAVLTTVTPGGPADRGGLARGDVIVEFNGQPVRDNEELVNMVVSTKPGTSVPVTVYRDKKRQTFTVTVDELDLDREQGRQGSRRPTPDQPAETGFGMEVAAVTPDIARDVNLPDGRGGAVVMNVDRNSPAAAAGIAPGDIILEVNRQQVSNVSQVQRELQRVGSGEPAALVVWRMSPAGVAQEYFVMMMKR